MKQWIALLLSGASLLALCACTQKKPEESPKPSTVVTSIPAESDTSSVKQLDQVAYPKALGFEEYEAQFQVREDNPISEETVKSINQFAYQTAAALFRAGKNETYSPLSLYMALSLCATGSDGATKAELLKLLGADDLDTLSAQCGNFYRTLFTDNEVTQLRTANSLWISPKLTCKDTFLKNGAEQFYAEIYAADFSKQETGKAMGDWIAKQTNGTLAPELQTSPAELLHLINTVYLKDQWADAFEESSTVQDTFHGASGDAIMDFMQREIISGSFSLGDGFTRAALGLKSGCSMTFVLPDSDGSVNSFLASAEALQAALEEGESYSGKVTWKIPKFSINADYDLKAALQSLGISSAFSENADFSAMTDDPVLLSSAIQQTHIAVNEKGVEASAFTDLAYAGAAMPNETKEAKMILDRPFLYAITDQTGALLFVGVCQDGPAA